MRKLLFIVIVLFSSLATAQKAWEPGHYILGGNNAANEADAIARIQASPQHWKGLAIWRDWNQMENAIQGQYDFSNVQNVVDILKPLNKKLVVFIQEKGWGEIVTPAYMQNNPLYGYPGYYSDGYYIPPNKPNVRYAAIWNPNVQARWFELHRAFVNNFKDEPTVIMVLTSETTYNPDIYALPDNSRPIMIDALLESVSVLTADYAGTHIQFARGANAEIFESPDTFLEQLCPLIFETGAAGSGPGVKPGNITVAQSVCYIPSNNGYGTANDFVIAMQAQGPDYGYDQGAEPLEPTWLHATQVLNVNYLFWSHTTGPLFGIQDVQNKIAGDPTRDIETIVPINLDVELPNLPFVPPVIDNVVIN